MEVRRCEALKGNLNDEPNTLFHKITVTMRHKDDDAQLALHGSVECKI